MVFTLFFLTLEISILLNHMYILFFEKLLKYGNVKKKTNKKTSSYQITSYYYVIK